MDGWDDCSDNDAHPRDSIATFDSDFSLAASSIFSNGRPASLASTHTAYSLLSSPSLRSCYSPRLVEEPYAAIQTEPRASPIRRAFAPPVLSPGLHHISNERDLLRTVLRSHYTPADDPYQTAQRAVITAPTHKPSVPDNPIAKPKATLAEKKINNKFACSHCSKTFTKRADRKVHWKERCQYLCEETEAKVGLPPPLVCPSCSYVGRNEHQIKQHQRLQSHYQGTWEQIRLWDKPRFTCSDDPQIYRTAVEFFTHFSNNTCSLNHHDTHSKWFHHSRLLTLLQEGRDDRSGQHSSTYAALLIHCSKHNMTETDWRAIISSYPEDAAQKYAEKLEWGLALPPLSPAMMRLGFTNLSQFIAEILPFSQSLNNASASPRSIRPVQPNAHYQQTYSQFEDQPQPQQHQRLSQNSCIKNQLVASIRAAPDSQSHRYGSHEGIGRGRTAESGLSSDLVPSTRGAGEEQQTQLMAPPTASADDALFGLQSMWLDTTLDEASFNDALIRGLEPTTWLDMTEALSAPEMALKQDASAVFPSDFEQRTRHAMTPSSSDESVVPGQYNAQLLPEDWSNEHASSIPQSIVTPHDATSFTHLTPKAKRPISKTSEVHPESLVRSQRQNRLPIRLSSGESKVKDWRRSHTAKTMSHRESSESTGFLFDYQKYDQDSVVTLAEAAQLPQPRVSTTPVSMIHGVLVPGPGEHYVQASPSRRCSVPERPKTTSKEKLKACAKKLFSVQVTELEEGDFFARPQSGDAKPAQIGQCTHCGEIGDPECLSGHISEVRLRRKRQGTVFEESDLRDLQDLFSSDESRSVERFDEEQRSLSF